MDDLVERLEKATGPDREIDNDIAVFVGYRLANCYASLTGEPDFKTWHAPDGRYVGQAPQFTGSIDAALMLVPDGWAWRVMQEGPRANQPSLPRAELAEPVLTAFGPGVGVRAQTKGTTPAIALCIASLRAMNASPKRLRRVLWLIKNHELRDHDDYEAIKDIARDALRAPPTPA